MEKLTIKSFVTGWKDYYRVRKLAEVEIDKERFAWLDLAEKVDNWTCLGWVEQGLPFGGYLCKGSLGDLIFEAEKGGVSGFLYGARVLSSEGVEIDSGYSYGFESKEIRKRIKNLYKHAKQEGMERIEAERDRIEKERNLKREEGRLKVESLLSKLE